MLLLQKQAMVTATNKMYLSCQLEAYCMWYYQAHTFVGVVHGWVLKFLELNNEIVRCTQQPL